MAFVFHALCLVIVVLAVLENHTYKVLVFSFEKVIHQYSLHIRCLSFSSIKRLVGFCTWAIVAWFFNCCYFPHSTRLKKGIFCLVKSPICCLQVILSELILVHIKVLIKWQCSFPKDGGCSSVLSPMSGKLLDFSFSVSFSSWSFFIFFSPSPGP